MKFHTDADETLWLDMIRNYIQSGRLSDNQRAIEFADNILEALRERRSPITVQTQVPSALTEKT